MVNRSDFSSVLQRTQNIEIRVGHSKPVGTNGNDLFTTNSICGLFVGPPESLGSTSSVTCSAPLVGRYVTLQRIDNPEKEPINWVEVQIDSTPGGKTEEIEFIFRTSPEDGVTGQEEGVTGQCTSRYKYAFGNGEKCCITSIEVRPNSYTNPMESGSILTA